MGPSSKETNSKSALGTGRYSIFVKLHWKHPPFPNFPPIVSLSCLCLVLFLMREERREREGGGLGRWFVTLVVCLILILVSVSLHVLGLVSMRVVDVGLCSVIMCKRDRSYPCPVSSWSRSYLLFSHLVRVFVFLLVLVCIGIALFCLVLS